jgi:hypothetical protein
MARTTVKLLPKGMRELLQNPPGDLAGRAEAVLAAAKADPHDKSYDYENGLYIDRHVGPNRVRYRIVSGDFKGYILEAKFGILSRALDAAGGRRG